MKCFFCKEPCRLLRRNDPDYYKRDMVWLCDRHPTVQRVEHKIEIEKRYQRFNSKQTGSIHTWVHTKVQWVNGKGLIYRAYWIPEASDRYGDSDERFYVTVENPNRVKRVAHTGSSWDPIESVALELEEFPVGFTPENIQSKISTYLIFS